MLELLNEKKNTKKIVERQELNNDPPTKFECDAFQVCNSVCYGLPSLQK